MFNKIKGVIKRKYNDKINIDLIKKSNLFSSKYYRFENPEVKKDPAKHYYYYGYKEGKSPSYEFSNEAYLKMYKDVSQREGASTVEMLNSLGSLSRSLCVWFFALALLYIADIFLKCKSKKGIIKQ